LTLLNPQFAGLESKIETWLQEDIGSGDVTTLATIPANQISQAVIHAKQAGIVAGLPIAQMVFHIVDPSITFTTTLQDGDAIEHGTVLAQLEGRTQSILLGERLALNLMQRLSGIATLTHKYVEAMGTTTCRIADTRKTTPGLRALEKYAVRAGGGANHRFGLYDAVMIKDNHIKGAGSIAQAVAAARAAIPHTMKIEVEVESDAQLQEAIHSDADIIMLDNMGLERMTQAVKAIKTAKPHVIVEASGGVNLKSVGAIVQTGVDVISSGALTSNAGTLDISLDLYEKKEVLG
jgi:nicotinate-nucleotide pyrophosphorylase (carboxylating)